MNLLAADRARPGAQASAQAQGLARRVAGQSAAYRAEIDGLRALAVLAVVGHHLLGRWLPGGYVGVDVFFVISGFLITRIIVDELECDRFSFAGFYERRARRIFPALFVMLAITLAAAHALMLPVDLAGVLRATVGAVLFVSNLVFWGMGSGYFDQLDSRTNPLLHTWSLGVEEQFYLLFPVFVVLVARWLPRWLPAALAAVAAVSLGGALVLVHTNSAAAFYLAPLRGWELLGGALLAVRVVPAARSRLMRELLVGGGLAGIIAACLLFDEHTVFPGAAALLPVLGTAAVIHGAAGGPAGTVRLLTHAPAVYLGQISYSLYLWHWPVLVMAQYASASREPSAWKSVLLFLVCLTLASASYHFVERPFRRRTGAAARHVARPAALAASVAGAILVYCTAGLWAAGFPHRFAPEVTALDAARQPAIPFRECSDRLPARSCRIGRSDGAEPDMLLWGDSHLIAWAPVLDQLLAAGGRAAVLAPATGCAPLVGLGSRNKPSCARFNADLREYLEHQPQIRTVLLAAFWSTYMREDGPLQVVRADGQVLDGAAAAAVGLKGTVKWLLSTGREVVLLGPVPVYGRDVPAALALEAAHGTQLLDRSREAQLRLHRSFLDAVAQLPADPRLRVVDPIGWMCRVDCEVQRGPTPLYRDSHHLSLAGASALGGALRQALGFPSAPQPAGGS